MQTSKARDPIVDPKVGDEVRLVSGFSWKALAVNREQGRVYVKVDDGCWVSLGNWTRYATEVIHAAD